MANGIGSRNERLLRRMLANNGCDLVIGVGGMASIEDGTPLPGSLRVGMQRGDVAMMLTAKEARKLADRFDADPVQCRAAGVTWIPQTLRECAEEIDAKVRAQH